MRRIFSIVLVSIVFVLTACGGDSDDSGAQTVPATDAPVEAVTEEPTAQLTPTNTPTDEPETTPDTIDIAQQSADITCDGLVEEVLTVVDDLCDITGRNEVCYGNVSLQVEPRADIVDLAFDAPGDIAALTDIQSISLSMMNLDELIWGVALMRLQADIADTLPGQNVTFLLFGDVQMENLDAESTGLQSFYFTTGVGDAPCREAPDSGILIQTPEGVGEVNFQVNQVDIALGSTAYLQAQPGRDLVVNVVEGQAEVEANGETQVVTAGNRTRVALDESGNAAGEPSAPTPYTEDNVRNVTLPVNTLPEEIVIIPPAVVVDHPYSVGTQVQADIGQPGEIDRYAFTVDQEADYYFAAQGEEGRVFWSLERTTGEVIFNNRELWLYNDPGTFALSAGEYIIDVAGQNGTEGSYTFQAWRIPEAQSYDMSPGDTITTDALGAGSGVLEEAGAVDIYTFTPQTNRPIYFAALGEGEDATIFWSLKTPDNVALFEDSQLWLGNDPGEFVLEAGTEYTIFVNARGNEVGEYSFATWIVPEPQTFDLSLETVTTSGAIDQRGLVHEYTFTLDSAQGVYFGGGNETEDGNLLWTLTNENGDAIFADEGLWQGNEPGEITLDAGTYTLRIFGDNGITGTYDITVRDAVADEAFEGGGLNQLYTGEISAPEQSDTYTFSVPAGATVYFDAQVGNSRMRWSVLDASGEAILGASRSDIDLGEFVFTEGGDYQLVINGTDNITDPASYEIYLWDVPDDARFTAPISPAERILDGEDDPYIVTGRIDTPGATNRYSITLDDQQRLFLQSVMGTSQTRWSIIDGDGNELAGTTRTDINLGVPNFPGAGDYEIVVTGSGDGIGDYAFKVWEIPQAQSFDTQITPADRVDQSFVSTGEIATPGQIVFYNFTVNAGQTVYFDAVTGSSQTRWALNNLNSVSLLGPSRTDIDLGEYTFEDGGQYFLIVTGSDDGTGEFSFQLWDVPEIQTFDTQITPVDRAEQPFVSTGEIVTPGQIVFYNFTVDAGQTVYFDAVTGSSQTRWALNDLNGASLLGSSRTDIDLGEYTFEDGGQYVLVVTGSTDGTGAFSFQLWDVPETVTTRIAISPPRVIPEGTDDPGIVNGRIVIPGATNTYTFTAEANQVVYIDSISGTSAVAWALLDMDGNVLLNASRTDFDLGLYQFEVAGSYTIGVSGRNDGTGEYSFKLWNVLQGERREIRAGDTVSGEILTPGVRDHYAITVRAGTTLFFESVSGTSRVQWGIITDLSGQEIIVNPTRTDFDLGAVTFTEGGTYLVRVTGRNDGTGAYSFTVRQP